MEIKSFEDLECWKAGRELRKHISILSRKFPKEEKYSLCDNLKRSARSVTNNIAEGYGRFHYQENIQFCRQSRGSLYEVIDHLIIALDENYISQEEYTHTRRMIDRTLSLLNGYINYLIRAKQNEKK